ncbi:MAG: ABC transporter permease [Polyangiaceae bacterium]|nr:ABC transporter permease [Myxococcales bacterium]MCB9585710.1 ABC transporter permease [Polyangiaceae bacterium]MCB9607361.1 ABC transporter permease [Polyangiaceae bacterium]
MSELLFDIRFSLRQLRHSPGFFATLLAVLIAGIGATTAMFSIAESLFMRQLPYEDSKQLDMIWLKQRLFPKSGFSYPDFLDVREQSESYEAVAAVDYAGYSLSAQGAEPEFVPSANVSADFFQLWKQAPLHGRYFTSDDDKTGAPRIAVIGAALWERRFDSDPGIVGRAITLNGNDYTVVGVAHQGFSFSGPYSNECQIWVPIHVSRPDLDEWGRGDHFAHIIGRRKPGVSLESAQAEVGAVMGRLEAKYPDTNTKVSVHVETLHEALVGGSRSSVGTLFGAVGLVFLIVCANVASLLLTRAQGRRAEMALRGALGAPRSRIVRQVLTETVVVFLVGAVGGSLLSFWLVELFRDGLVGGTASLVEVGVDWFALLATSFVCTLCGLLFGLIPALAVSSIEPQSVLKSSAARSGVSGKQKLVRSVLVVAQVTLACALLIGSGLALRGFGRIVDTPLGVDASNVMTGRLLLTGKNYDNEEKMAAFVKGLREKLNTLPETTHVIVNSCMPMMGSNNSGSFKIEGKPDWAPGERPVMERNMVGPGYFQALGTPLIRGREFTEADDGSARNIMIISQTAATKYFPDQDPIGKRIDWGAKRDDTPVWREIVGISADVRKNGPYDEPKAEAFVPYAQSPEPYVSFGVRSRDLAATAKAIPGAVQAVDPTLAVATLRPYEQRVASRTSTQRYAVNMLSAFALAALVLAGMGIFGLVSYSTQQRTRELGLRMALGSPPGAVMRLVVGGGLRLLAIGTLLGLLGAIWLGRNLEDSMPGVERFDLAAFAGIPLVLTLIGALACLLPAWKAMRMPPASALRYE